jgi:hypothetical protein
MLDQQLIRLQVSNKPHEPVIAAAAITAQRQRRWTDHAALPDFRDPFDRCWVFG